MILKILKFINESIIDSFRGLPKQVWYIALMQLINRSGMMILPFLALYLTKDLFWTKGEAAIATAMFGFGNFVGAIIGGWLCNRIAPLKIIFFSLIFGGIAFSLLVISTNFYFICIWLFIAVTIADLMRPAAMVAVSDYCNENNLTRGISLIRLAINLGIAIGPALGGLLIQSVGYSIIFIMDGVTCVAAGVFLVFVFKDLSGNWKPKEGDVQTSKMSDVIKDVPFMIFMFFLLVMLTIFFQILFAVPLYLKEELELSEASIGLFFTMNGLIIFFLEMPIIYSYEKKGLVYKPLVRGVFLIGIAHIFFLLKMDYVWIPILLYNLFVTVGEIINFPFISTVALKRGGAANKGSYVGIANAMFSISLILAPLVFMPFIDQIGYDTVWIICVATCILSGFGLLALRPYLHIENK